MTGAVTASLVDDAVTGAKIENNPTIAGNLTVSGDFVPSTALSHRNIIINGAMNVAQRSSLAFAHDGNTSGYSQVDRYQLTINTLSEWDGTMTQHTMTQAELNTTGFGKALKLTTGTAESSITSADALYFSQRIEAQNLQHLQYGTAGAKTITLSFWVKTSVTGTYAVGLYKPDGTSRNITAAYTTSGTGWEYKTLTFAGDTGAGGTIDNNNGTGLYLTWHLASGPSYDSSPNTSWGNYASANWAGLHAQDGTVTTASATFYITGVQLELGSNATPFEHRSYGEELARCQRYYWQDISARYRVANLDGTANYPTIFLDFPVPMRDAPDGAFESYAAIFYNNGSGQANFTPTGGGEGTSFSNLGGTIRRTAVSSGPGAAHGQKLGQWSTKITLNAEL
jgi:hypothetical protein